MKKSEQLAGIKEGFAEAVVTPELKTWMTSNILPCKSNEGEDLFPGRERKRPLRTSYGQRKLGLFEEEQEDQRGWSRAGCGGRGRRCGWRGRQGLGQVGTCRLGCRILASLWRARGRLFKRKVTWPDAELLKCFHSSSVKSGLWQQELKQGGLEGSTEFQAKQDDSKDRWRKEGSQGMLRSWGQSGCN